MRQKQGVFSLFLLSPSSRRAWIEITIEPSSCLYFKSPSSRRAWIEILVMALVFAVMAVALLAEGVDRNFLHDLWYNNTNGRPPRGGRG